MKTKIKEITYQEFSNILPYKRFKPCKPSKLLNILIKILSKKELKDCNFTYTKKRMDEITKKEPVLIIMNHSCFLDLKIAFKLLKNRKFNIIMTDDGFVGKAKLMRKIGCIPTMKFITDSLLVKDMFYCINKLKTSILLFPEASYSFDGTSTTLPKHLGKLIKKLNVAVVMIKTKNAFLHDPLYNKLQLRKVDVSAHMEVLLNKEEVNSLDIESINEIVKSKFNFNAFKEQIAENVLIREDFRADYLNKILYKCPVCGVEHNTFGKGITLKCLECKSEFILNENGTITSDKKVKFDNVSDWYNYQKDSVIDEIKNNKYLVSFECDIYAMKDLKAIYKIGKGNLTHSMDGFHLTGCNGLLDYKQKVKESYSVYSDFYWYEIDDIICIGDHNARYYLVPTSIKDVVAKIRIASEELYKMETNHD